MFIDFSIKDLIDILLVAYLLYQTYRLMKDSGSINIFIGILVFIGIWLIVSQVLEMKLLGSIFDKLVSVGVLALIILFQDDIRRFLVTLGSHKQLGRFFRFLTGNKQEKTEKADIMPIVLACMSMSKGKVGALIVIEKSVPLNDIIRTGEIINANVNQRLIENIFYSRSWARFARLRPRTGHVCTNRRSSGYRRGNLKSTSCSRCLPCPCLPEDTTSRE